MDFMKNLKSKTEISTDMKIEQLPIDDIYPDKEQVRKTFEEESLQDLATSIKQQGIQSPIHVLQSGKKQYTIIMGERRYRASQIAGLDFVPCIVHREKISPKEIKALQLIENLQREDLTGIETAKGFLTLKETGISQSQVARELGVSEGYVSKGLAILKKLPEDWITEIETKFPKASIYDIYNNVAKVSNKKKRETAYLKFIKQEEELVQKTEEEISPKKSKATLEEQDYLDAWERIKVIVKRDKSKLSQFVTKKRLLELANQYRENKE